MKREAIYRYGYKWIVYNAKEKRNDLSYESGAYLIRIKKKENRKWIIVYAGETKCLRSRMPSHLVINTLLRKISNHQTTDIIQVLFHPCEFGYRKKLENSFIYRYTPMYNYIDKYRRRQVNINLTSKNRWKYFDKKVSNG